MQLAIDAADDTPGLAIAVDGVAGLTLTWETNRNHSIELLPNIDRLLTESGRTKSDIEAVFVDVGPGGYAALRVGVSIAKALAHGLAVPIVGVGRLELDAWAASRDAGISVGRLVALHRAGRGELALAAYSRNGEAWLEAIAPTIVKSDELVTTLMRSDAVTGDIDDDAADAIGRADAIVASASKHRVVALGELGHRRLIAGQLDDATSLVPMYLRPPAIGPQPPKRPI